MSKSKLRNSYQKRALKITLAKNRTHVKCCFCKREITINNATLEHITPLAFGGDWSIDNLALSCGECNSDRGIANFELYRKWRRGQITDKPQTLLIFNGEQEIKEIA